MLSEIRIRNFAIIESVALQLQPGFNVLSGETGAGKSIIVGALGFLLGERGSADLVRTGADKTAVEGVFDVSRLPDVAAWADERGVDVEEGVLILKRELSSAGRGRAWVNGTPVTAATLSEIGRMLVSLHGQHEAQTLIDSPSQRRILDAFAEASETAERVADAWRSLSAVRVEIADLARRRQDAARREDYLRHVAAEIESAALTPGEDVRVEEEARVLENAGELRELAAELYASLSDDEAGVLPRLDAARRALGAISRIDASAAELVELFDRGSEALEELARSAETYAERVELDPERLAQVRERREAIFRLTKKYGPSIEEVVETGRAARAELDLLDASGFDARLLEERERALVEQLSLLAGKLTKMRRSGAAKLTKSVDALLPELGLADGRFSVALERAPETGAHGDEEVTFHVALNPGHPARPLARVASGGELSRLMLALETILARKGSVPTLVFDEVDAGIGGAVGLQVGAMLRRVAAHHQVFAISHLPQLAARAHHHIVVQKGARGGVTTADVAVVAGGDRVEEIARMLGGDPASRVGREHAEELLRSGD
ncbi:MAG TPA: DNA repair protein RecN [Gemmatimonadaceae bacterium]